MKTNRISTFFALLLLAVGVASFAWAQGGNCQGRGNGQGGCAGGACQVDFTGQLDDADLIAGKLALAIEDEYHARSMYAAVIAEFGDVRPFSRIIQAEQRHIDALARLYVKYGLEVPADPFVEETYEFADLLAAGQAALDAEIANAELYDELFDGVSDPDVIAVFENLQWASSDRHLPALERFVENGGTYGGGTGGGRGNGGGRGWRGGR